MTQTQLNTLSEIAHRSGMEETARLYDGMNLANDRPVTVTGSAQQPPVEKEPQP